MDKNINYDKFNSAPNFYRSFFMEEKKGSNMPVEIKETIEDIRNRLLTECKKEPEEQRAGYVNGILDFYNTLRMQQDKEIEL